MMMTMAFLGGGLGGGEIVIILAAALLLFGSKNLPKIARSLGRALEEFRRAGREVSTEIMRGADESEPPPNRVQVPDAFTPPREEPVKDPAHDSSA